MTGQTPIRIMSVDDHPLRREGLAALINNQTGMILVAQASNAQAGIAEFRKHKPDVTLMDLRLPDKSGIEALIAIRAEFPEERIIVFSTFGVTWKSSGRWRPGRAATFSRVHRRKSLLR